MAVLLALSLVVLLGPLVSRFRAGRAEAPAAARFGLPKVDLSYLVVLIAVGAMMVSATGWPWAARIGPQLVGYGAIVLTLVSAANRIPVRGAERADEPGAGAKRHMDTTTDFSLTGKATAACQGVHFFLFLIGFAASVAVVGYLVAAAPFTILYMRLDQREPWPLTIAYATILTPSIYPIFDRFLSVPWSSTLLGRWVPGVSMIPTI